MKTYKAKPFGDIDYWLAEWLKSSRRQSINTHEAYRRDAGQFLTVIAKPFDQVAVGDILEYQSSLSEFAPKTQARKMAAVRSFYRFLNNREVTSLNLARIEALKLQQQISRDKLLTEPEVQALIAAATNDQHRLFVRFLYLTAVRVSEALALRWRDITPFGDGSAEAHIIGKGNKRRDVYLPSSLFLSFELFATGSGDDLVFSFIKNRLHALRIVQGLAKATKINRPISPHSFRHAHISHALKNGATIAELQAQAGHASISTTGLYAHADGSRATATRLKVS